jgi:hypothetical protein
MSTSGPDKFQHSAPFHSIRSVSVAKFPPDARQSEELGIRVFPPSDNMCRLNRSMQRSPIGCVVCGGRLPSAPTERVDQAKRRPQVGLSLNRNV